MNHFSVKIIRVQLIELVLAREFSAHNGTPTPTPTPMPTPKSKLEPKRRAKEKIVPQKIKSRAGTAFDF